MWIEVEGFDLALAKQYYRGIRKFFVLRISRSE